MLIRTKITAAVGVVMVSSLGLLSTSAYYLSKSTITEASHDGLMVVALNQKVKILTLTSVWAERVGRIASMVKYQGLPEIAEQKVDPIARVGLEKSFENSLNDTPWLESIMLCSPQGEQLAAVQIGDQERTTCRVWKGDSRSAATDNISDRPINEGSFESESETTVIDIANSSRNRTLINDSINIAPFWITPDEGPPVLKVKVIAPIYTGKDSLFGSIQVIGGGQELLDIVQKDESLGESGEIILARRNEDGSLQLITPLRNVAERDLSATDFNNHYQLIQMALENQPVQKGETLLDYRGESVMAATLFIPRLNWGMVVKKDNQELLLPATTLANHFVIALALMTLLLLPIGLVITRRITRPFTDLVEVAESIKSGNVSDLTKGYRVGEAGMLAATFQHMMNSLKSITATHNLIDHQKHERELILNSVNEGIFKVDNNGIIIYMNNAASSHLGYLPEQLVGSYFHRILPIEHEVEVLEKQRSSVDLALQTLRSVIGHEEVFQKSCGDQLYVSSKVTPIFNSGADLTGAVIIFRDITEEREYTQNLNYLAHHDPLTKLFNRPRCLDYLMESIEQAEQDDETVAVIFVDIDGFKSINDYYGHEVGDSLLHSIAERIRNAVGPDGFVARFGGDEFVIIVNQRADSDRIQFITKSLLSSIARPVRVDEVSLKVTSSIGVAFYPEHHSVATGLLRNADQAMCEAKQAGRNQYRFYDDEIHQRIERENYLRGGLINAIANREIEVHYQPISDHRGKVCGFESLCRWTYQGEQVSPHEFIPLAEKCHLIQLLGKYVFDDALDFLDCIREENDFDGYVSVNVSLHQLHSINFASYMADELMSRGIPIDRCLLEITESKLVENFENFRETFEFMIEKGFSMALDDFGTGYASFHHLRLMPVQYLKIDQTFIRGVPENREAASTIATMLMLGKSLKMKTIVEGVENQRQSEWLSQYDCYQQGYFYSRPAAREAFVS